MVGAGTLDREQITRRDSGAGRLRFGGGIQSGVQARIRNAAGAPAKAAQPAGGTTATDLFH